jgi:hypothetical protein
MFEITPGVFKVLGCTTLDIYRDLLPIVLWQVNESGVS